MATGARLALEHLSQQEIDALQLLVSDLLSEFGSKVSQIVLFGSKARGDDTEDSDIDVLVIADEESRGLREIISRIASNIDLECDVLLNVFLISEDRWRQMSEERFSLCRNVERDGKVLFQREKLGRPTVGA